MWSSEECSSSHNRILSMRSTLKLTAVNLHDWLLQLSQFVFDRAWSWSHRRSFAHERWNLQNDFLTRMFAATRTKAIRRRSSNAIELWFARARISRHFSTLCRQSISRSSERWFSPLIRSDVVDRSISSITRMIVRTSLVSAATNRARMTTITSRTFWQKNSTLYDVVERNRLFAWFAMKRTFSSLLELESRASFICFRRRRRSFWALLSWSIDLSICSIFSLSFDTTSSKFTTRTRCWTTIESRRTRFVMKSWLQSITRRIFIFSTRWSFRTSWCSLETVRFIRLRSTRFWRSFWRYFSWDESWSILFESWVRSFASARIPLRVRLWSSSFKWTRFRSALIRRFTRDWPHSWASTRLRLSITVCESKSLIVVCVTPFSIRSWIDFMMISWARWSIFRDDTSSFRTTMPLDIIDTLDSMNTSRRIAIAWTWSFTCSVCR